MSVSNKMFVPKTITVGYRKRDDTYTGKLAYVIYTDDKGVLRKEKSWQSWRDEKLKSDQYDNTPRTGFVLNKKVGGYKSEWNVRNTYVRVWDPNDFEFEISVPNLLFILQETSSIQGKGLEGEFVYAWSGTELVLLPTCSAEYQACTAFTKTQAQKVAKEDRIEGCMYMMKDMTEVMYLGRHEYCEKTWNKDEYKPVGPRHIFRNLNKKKNETWIDEYIALPGFDKIAAKVSDVSPEYAKEYDKFRKSRYCDKVVEVKLSKIGVPKEKANGHCYLMKENDKYIVVRVAKEHYSYAWNRGNGNADSYYLVKGGQVDVALKKGTFAIPKRPNYSYRRSDSDSQHVTYVDQELYAAYLVTEKGHQYNFTGNIY